MFSLFPTTKRDPKKFAASLSLYLLIKLIHCFDEIIVSIWTNRIDTLLRKNNHFFSFSKRLSTHLRPYVIFWTPNPYFNTASPGTNNLLIPLCPPHRLDEDESFQPADPYHHKQQSKSSILILKIIVSFTR